MIHCAAGVVFGKWVSTNHFEHLTEKHIYVVFYNFVAFFSYLVLRQVPIHVPLFLFFCARAVGTCNSASPQIQSRFCGGHLNFVAGVSEGIGFSSAIRRSSPILKNTKGNFFKKSSCKNGKPPKFNYCTVALCPPHIYFLGTPLVCILFLSIYTNKCEC